MKPPYTNKWELCDLSTDRAESNNLSNQLPGIASELEAKWDTWAKENEVLPIDGRSWDVKIESDVNTKK